MGLPAHGQLRRQFANLRYFSTYNLRLAIGVALRLPLAFGVANAVSAVAFNVEARDPIVGVVAMLIAVLASWVRARRVRSNHGLQWDPDSSNEVLTSGC